MYLFYITHSSSICFPAFKLTKPEILEWRPHRGAVLRDGVWHHYYGLWERNSRGQGLKQYKGKPSTPSGFLLSHCAHFRRDFALKSSLPPVICCEYRIIYKAQKLDNESRFHCSKHTVPLFIHADILPLNFLYFKSLCC